MKPYRTINFTDLQLRNLPLGTYKVQLVAWREYRSDRTGCQVTTYTFRVPALGDGFVAHVDIDVVNTLQLGDMYATVMAPTLAMYRKARVVRFSHFCLPGADKPIPSAHAINGDQP